MSERPSLSESSAEAGAPPPTFEASMKRLTEIVQSLERGDLALEDSLRLFEEGIALARISQTRLDAAEKRVEQLLSVDDRGRVETIPFDTDAADSDSE
jgi:exodeoxyribonuclease VII small subunit